MERIEKIIQHHIYQDCLREIATLEAERVFCGHDMQHFLDVARIAYILNLEEGLQIPKERIYAAALLHDIGRHRQYLEGIPHEQASAVYAGEILDDCGYEEAEKQEILTAVLSHRDREKRTEESLAGILYRADKLSRNCFACEAEAAWDWSEEKKNRIARY